MKTTFGSKRFYLAEYKNEFSWSQRNHLKLLTSIIDFSKWLNQKHLEGYVFSGFNELKLKSSHTLVFNKEFLQRPQTNFSKLHKAEISGVEFRSTTDSMGMVEKLLSSPKLIISPSGKAPESAFNHHDYRSDIYCLGILIVELFSDCDTEDIEALRELIANKVSDFKWFNPNLQILAKACLEPLPLKRISFSELIVNLEKVVVNTKLDSAQDNNSYQSILKGFKASLLDFSSRNQLYNFTESNQYLTIRADLGNIFKYGINWEFELEDVAFDLKKLHGLRRKHNALLREKGEDGLMLISHFLHWQNGDDYLKTPFLIANIEFDYSKSFKHKYSLKIESEQLLINEVLRIYFKEYFNFQLPRKVALNQIDQFINEITTRLSTQGAKIQSVSNELVLGVFNYHNIAIASDYEDLHNSEANAINAKILGFEKSGIESSNRDELPWNEHYVLPADPSQQSALQIAKSQSLVIEGPPGTGKSQTIVNLLAQALANNEKVLFVSEKRAALDVVFKRLENAELGELALLVHNPKKEKKAIIDSIANSFNRLVKPLERDANLGKNLASWNIEETFEKLNKYFETVRTKQNGFSLNELFLFDSKLDYEYKDEWVPDLGDWLSQKELIKEIDQLLKKMNADTVWQKNIFSNLEARSFALNQDPSKLYSNSLNQANAAAYGIQSLTNKLEVELYIGDLLQIRSWAKSIKWLIEKNLTQLVLDDNGFKKDYQKLRDQYFAKKALIEKRSIKTNNTGLQEVSIRELESALSKCEVTPNENELKRFVGKFISNDEWFIDDVKNILKNAIYERKNELQLTELTAKFQSYYKTNDPENFIEQVSLLQDLTNRMQYHLQGFFGFLNKKRFPDALMQMFLQYNSELQQLEECGFVLHQNFRQFTIDEFQIYLNELKTIDFSLELEQLLKLFNGLKPNLKFCFEHAKIPILELEKAAVQRELQRAYLANPELETFNSQKLNQLSDKLNSEYNEWLKWNSWKLLDAQVLEFQRLLQLSETPATKLGDLEKQEKWSFKKGIRIIRNEIDKTRQHKSLRELVHSDAKNALDVLKPIYLMSPVAVAETFPCKKELFDVVVFDEASQLRVEEVLPIVHRAKRVVVVGDSEQLPPTDFFKSTSLQAETADNLKFSSFLMAAKAAFKSQQLSWHYRSLSQELIQFSNAAFYQNNLKVFPSFNAPKPALKSIRVEGVYENRQNQAEAKSLVDHFAELLKNDRKSSFAIITLSEAQLEAVELAMQVKRKTDAAFNQLMEREESRFENGAFEGLLVKNLENMQGEERDVVLMSIGYGFDADRNFRQNFGPIMREGGDRRLNVLFSRAKAQMLVFHSFDFDELTNDQNVGLWTLKQFLKYAKAVENGNVEQSQSILKLMSRSQVQKEQVSKENSNLFHSVLNKSENLKPIEVANSEEQLYYQRIENDVETSVIAEFEAVEPNTWSEFFVAKRVLENRGFEVEKVSTQEMAKSTS